MTDERSTSVGGLIEWYRELRQSRPPVVRGRWPAIRREHTLDALASLSIVTLCFSQSRREVLFLADWGFYNRVPIGAATLAALLVNIVGLAAVGFLTMQALRRVRRPAARRLAALAAAASVLIAVNFARLTHDPLDRWLNGIGRPPLLALVVLILIASFGWPQWSLRVLRGVALAASPLAVLTLGHALWMFLETAAGPVWRHADPAPLARPSPSLRRVVWLVFAELDQRITFEARPAGLELPELDRLRRQSLYADAALPPAGAPELSMPALITGRPVVAVAPVNPNDLELTFSRGETARWSMVPNVFSRARAMGYDTAVIGWYLPYPRVFGGALGVGHWRPSEVHEQARGQTFSESFRNQWASLVPPLNARRLSSERASALGELAIRTAGDSRFALVLLHLPVPRLPGIYDRVAGQLTSWTLQDPGKEYLDNLALADRIIAELRRILQRARLADRTWLVVTADQSWSASSRYDGRVDHRVPFLVQPPDGGRATHVDGALNTLAAHDLVLAILRGTISDTSDAVAWLARNPVAPPRDYTREGRPIY